MKPILFSTRCRDWTWESAALISDKLSPQNLFWLGGGYPQNLYPQKPHQGAVRSFKIHTCPQSPEHRSNFGRNPAAALHRAARSRENSVPAVGQAGGEREDPTPFQNPLLVSASRFLQAAPSLDLGEGRRDSPANPCHHQHPLSHEALATAALPFSDPLTQRGRGAGAGF